MVGNSQLKLKMPSIVILVIDFCECVIDLTNCLFFLVILLLLLPAIWLSRHHNRSVTSLSEIVFVLRLGVNCIGGVLDIEGMYPISNCDCQAWGLWDVTRDGDGSNEGCILRIYVDVVFSKKIIFKGKIVQSTVEECREAYAIWINMAHELLKQKNLEKQEAGPTLSMIHEEEIHSEREVEPGEASENSYKPRGHVRMQQTSSSVAVSQQADDLVQGHFTNATSITSSLGEYATKLFSFSKSQSQISLVLVIAFIVIILMQVSILVLLNRPQTVHVASPEYNMGGLRAGAGENSAEAVAWLERRTHHLKDEMFMVEAKLERLQQEHSWLKSQLKNLDNLEKHK
ncbi:hypothetical protein POTOM_047748 [Populus tomentosa]|uniref:VASt domain-containing protein n=1 Tax=Populus tomentosa TaxID=118781 RepID=A0A8X7YFC7_POPTO|nr:hypothetical protein POTOM_047748 [Populus tomentosa]